MEKQISKTNYKRTCTLPNILQNPPKQDTQYSVDM